MEAAKTVGVCNSLWCGGNNAWGHSRGCGQGSCGFMDANGKDVETRGDRLRFFFAAPSGSSRLVMTLSMSQISWLQPLCQSTSLGNSHTIRNVGVSMETWRSKGSAPIRLTLGQSLLLARRVGGRGLVEGNIAWLVIICRSENPSRCLPRGLALPSSPLIDPPAIVSNACAGLWECGRRGVSARLRRIGLWVQHCGAGAITGI